MLGRHCNVSHVIIVHAETHRIRQSFSCRRGNGPVGAGKVEVELRTFGSWQADPVRRLHGSSTMPRPRHMEAE